MEFTAILVRWLEDASARPCPFDELIVIAANTGDEYVGYIGLLPPAIGAAWEQVSAGCSDHSIFLEGADQSRSGRSLDRKNVDDHCNLILPTISLVDFRDTPASSA